MLEWLEHFMVDVIGDYGYQAIFVLMVLESALIPIPSEVTMVFGGFLVSRGDLSFFWVGMLGAVANLVGSWIAYWIGMWGGRPLVERFGKYIFLRPHEIDRAHDWFERHGEAAVFFSRLLPVVRTFISLPAGIVGMNFWKFTIFTFLGCLPWTFALTWAGVLLGNNWETVPPVRRADQLGHRRRPARGDHLVVREAVPGEEGHGAPSRRAAPRGDRGLNVDRR